MKIEVNIMPEFFVQRDAVNTRDRPFYLFYNGLRKLTLIKPEFIFHF